MKGEIPAWASKSDEAGNVYCKVCNYLQASSFKACISCCPHEELNFVEDGYSSALDLECKRCGKNFGFTKLIKNYKVVKKHP